MDKCGTGGGGSKIKISNFLRTSFMDDPFNDFASSHCMDFRASHFQRRWKQFETGVAKKWSNLKKIARSTKKILKPISSKTGVATATPVLCFLVFSGVCHTMIILTGLTVATSPF